LSGLEVRLDLLGLFEHSRRVVIGGLERASAAAAWMFWPTMMIGSSTSWRKV